MKIKKYWWGVEYEASLEELRRLAVDDLTQLGLKKLTGKTPMYVTPEDAL